MPIPQLYVFAGPNGAGKSTLAESMIPSGTPYFDGDLRFTALKKTFYTLDDADLWAALNNVEFPKWRQEHIATRQDAAFETNFRDPDIMLSVAEFTSAGYESRLIFMGLDSVEASIERVRLRVAKGGHQVSIEYININYEQSLLNLQKFYHQYTSAHIYQNFQGMDASEEVAPLITIRKGEVTEIAEELPEWASDFLTTIKL